MAIRYVVRPARLLSVPFLMWACASSPNETTRLPTGTSGPVEWEVTDVGRIARPDGMRLCWSYTIVLREKAGAAVQFEAIERGILQFNVATGGFARTAFTRRLDARSELRYSAVDTWGWSSSGGPQFGSTAALGSVLIERRFIGKDANGQTVVMPVRVELHAGTGRRSRQPALPDPPLPPAQSLQAADLAGLAGRWEGYYQAGAFHVPVEATIEQDGRVEVRENDPITNRFRGSFSIRDGRVWYAGRDTGDFVLHQDGPTRLLVGRLTLAASGSAPPESIPVRLEWKGSPGGPPTSARAVVPASPNLTASGNLTVRAALLESEARSLLEQGRPRRRCLAERKRRRRISVDTPSASPASCSVP